MGRKYKKTSTKIIILEHANCSCRKVISPFWISCSLRKYGLQDLLQTTYTQPYLVIINNHHEDQKYYKALKCSWIFKEIMFIFLWGTFATFAHPTSISSSFGGGTLTFAWRFFPHSPCLRDDAGGSSLKWLPWFHFPDFSGSSDTGEKKNPNWFKLHPMSLI